MGTDLKKIKKLIDKVIEKAEEEALAEGVNIASNEFQRIVLELKQKLLSEAGISVAEFEEWEELQKNKKKKDFDLKLSELEIRLLEKY